MSLYIRLTLLRRLSFFLLATPAFCFGERGSVVVQVQDPARHPLRGVKVGVDGYGGSKVTGDDGKAKLALGAGAKENDWLTLSILGSPPGKDYVMISPYDFRSPVPSFEDKPENFIRIVVVQRGDRAALENGDVLASFAAKIIKANTPKSAEKSEPSKVNLEAIAKQYGLKPEDIDEAIRALGQRTTDPYEAGLAALYERNYPKASEQLQDSLRLREAKLTNDKQSVAQDERQVADAAFFVGSSLYVQGQYNASAQAFQRSLAIRGDDPPTLNVAALSLGQAGHFAAAEPLFRKALDIREKTLGPNDPEVAISLNNLAQLDAERGNYVDAEPLVRRALAIWEQVLGPDHLEVAFALNNLALLLKKKGDYAAAEPLYKRSLAIREETLGPNSLEVAASLNNMAVLLEAQGNYPPAVSLLRRALTIREGALGPDHPDVATSLNNLADLLYREGDYAPAEPLLERALEIREKKLGPDNPDVATSLNSLAKLMHQKGDIATAERLFRRAIAIREGALGPNHPDLAISLNDMATLLKDKGEYDAAESLLRRALAINEKEFGPDYPDVALNLNNLALVLEDKRDYADAEPLLRRALAIDTKALGPDHPYTRKMRANLSDLLYMTKGSK